MSDREFTESLQALSLPEAPARLDEAVLSLAGKVAQRETRSRQKRRVLPLCILTAALLLLSLTAVFTWKPREGVERKEAVVVASVQAAREDALALKARILDLKLERIARRLNQTNPSGSQQLVLRALDRELKTINRAILTKRPTRSRKINRTELKGGTKNDKDDQSGHGLPVHLLPGDYSAGRGKC